MTLRSIEQKADQHQNACDQRRAEGSRAPVDLAPRAARRDFVKPDARLRARVRAGVLDLHLEKSLKLPFAVIFVGAGKGLRASSHLIGAVR